MVEAQRAELGVAAAHAHAAHAHVGGQLGHGSLAAQLIPASREPGGQVRAAAAVGQGPAAGPPGIMTAATAFELYAQRCGAARPVRHRVRV